ncbi:MAG TPA: DNA topoisomerase [Ruminococcus flavefaciens]|nr:DNA topoisomerase [Ruminococcus flavefaciens]
MENELRDMVSLICTHIPCCNGISVTSPDIQRNINNSKVSDHHAIIPTDNIRKFDLSTLPEGEMNILSLISAKVICAVSAPHKYEAVKAVLKCEGTDFSATGRTVVQDGWKATDSRIKAMLKKDKEDSDEKVDTSINFSAKALSALSEGQIISSVKSCTSEHWTTPPKPYTEDTLLKAMETAGNKDYDENADVEKKGIGTPATRAPIIESLVKRQYIQRKKKQIFPTEKGIELINVVPDEVKNAKMTADWETELQSVEKGLRSAQSFIQKIEVFTRNLCSTYSSVADNAVFTKKAEGGATGKCPKCGSEVKKGKFGYYCTNKCGMNLSKVYGKVLTDTQLQHLLEGKQITYTVKDKKTIVLPEVEENNYQGKTYYQWKVKRNER